MSAWLPGSGRRFEPPTALLHRTPFFCILQYPRCSHSPLFTNMPFHRHRNSQERIYIEGATYFIASVTDDRIVQFREPILCELFIEDLWFARELKVIDLHGYTVIPEHFHLQITPSEKSDYSRIMGD